MEGYRLVRGIGRAGKMVVLRFMQGGDETVWPLPLG